MLKAVLWGANVAAGVIDILNSNYTFSQLMRLAFLMRDNGGGSAFCVHCVGVIVVRDKKQGSLAGSCPLMGLLLSPRRYTSLCFYLWITLCFRLDGCPPPKLAPIIILTLTIFIRYLHYFCMIWTDKCWSKNDEGSAEDQMRECSEVLIVGRAGPRWSQIKGRWEAMPVVQL